MITRGEFDSFIREIREKSPDVNAISVSIDAARHIGFEHSLLWDYTSQKFIFIHDVFVVYCETDMPSDAIYALVCSPSTAGDWN